jgi:hypothetical protein
MKDQAKELLLIISSVMNVECNLSKDNLQVHKKKAHSCRGEKKKKA